MNKVTALNEVTASNEVIWPPKNSKFHAWVKKCYFDNFSEIG